MNTNQLRHIMTKDIFLNKLKCDIFAIDELPKIVAAPFAYIINTEKSNKPGEHWLAIFQNSDEEDLEFFDSYGMPLQFYSLDKYLRNHGNTYKEQSSMLQSPLSLTCGEHAIYFLIHRSRGRTFADILLDYTEDQRRNDQKVYTFVHEKYPGTEPTTLSKLNFVKRVLGE